MKDYPKERWGLGPLDLVLIAAHKVIALQFLVSFFIPHLFG